MQSLKILNVKNVMLLIFGNYIMDIKRYPPTKCYIKEKSSYKCYKKVIKKLRKFSNIQVIRELSQSEHRYAKENELDFVFIDANHENKYVYNYINMWFLKFKKGSIIVVFFVKHTHRVVKTFDV